MNFSAPWGRLLKVITGCVVLLMLFIVVTAVLKLPVVTPIAGWLAIVLPLGLLLATALFTIRGYRLDGERLFVRRLLWETELSLHGLESAKVDPNAMRWSIRMLGNGGLFSFTGYYWNRKLGRYRALATDLHRTVVLRLRDRTMVLTPDDPDRFVQAVTGLIPHSA